LKRLAALFLKYKLVLLAALKPLGYWGIGAIALLDSSSIPVPMDLIVAGYAWSDRRRVVLYVLMAAIGSAIGGLLPFFLGRAGGELFLLKRIDRVRYEQLRDRFERQEFLALLIPSMLPPPTPWKLFVFGAGVFEMKPVWFFSAIFLGKFVRFLIWAAITVFYGPAIVQTIGHAFHEHLGLILAGIGAIIVLLALFVTRKIFDRRNGTSLPIEDADRPA